jgi:methionyl-tRNA formyltransferase
MQDSSSKKLKVVFVTQDDPFYIPQFFDNFNKINTDKEIDIFGVVIQKALGKKNLKDLVSQMYEFYGLFNFLRVGIKYVWYKVNNLIALKIFNGNYFGLFSVEYALKKHKWNILPYINVNSDAFIKFIQSNDISLIVSVGGSQKFKTPILNAPKYGCINIHNSKLPKNRGMLPTFWALLDYENDPTTAMTVFKMDENWDSGDIILQEEVALNPKESLEDLISRIKKMNARIILKAIQMHKNGLPTYHPNDDTKASYFSFPKTDDIKRFKEKGYKIF